jgi:hypothetical protein
VQVGDGVRRCSCDVAFDGGDACVLWLIVGHHVEDLFVSRLDSRSTVNVIKAKLEEWGVREENFTYDLNGLGQTLKGFFPRALPFCNTEAVDDKYKNVYHDLKSQAAYLFARDIINGEYSINPELLKRKYSGRGYENTPLAQILNRERKAIRQDDNDDGHGWKIIKKVIMKRLVGHSPDFMEGLLMIKIFDIKKRNRHFKGLGLL